MDPNKSVEDRIRGMIEDIGVSVVATTATSVLAFGLGCLSSVPVIYGLCTYAYFTITWVLFYQLTFFVAAIVLDENRVQDGRRDCCTWATVTKDDLSQRKSFSGPVRENAIERFMSLYAKQLLRPAVKMTVILSFTGLAVYCAYAVSQLKQHFDIMDALPRDSYLTNFYGAVEEYSSRSLALDMGVYFRGVNQLDLSGSETSDNSLETTRALQSTCNCSNFCRIHYTCNYMGKTLSSTRRAIS